MTLGIAIPCTAEHLVYLPACLDSIAASSSLPKIVSVSVSSVPDEIAFAKAYPFDLKIQSTRERRSAAENRNAAAALLDTKIISFVDADDLVHRQRNEFLLQVFGKGAAAVCHDYVAGSEGYEAFLSNKIENLVALPRYIDTVQPGVPFPVSRRKHLDYHCAHVSVPAEIFERVKFPEGDAQTRFALGEDAAYCCQLVAAGNPIDYIANALTFYRSATAKRPVLKGLNSA